MKILQNISILIVASATLVSCSNYGLISENDVYMQAPTEIDLNEDENDITSFNAFKANQRGAFEQEYVDPRLNQQVMFNRIMIRSAYMPFGSSYGFHNRPLAFHGMGGRMGGMYDPVYNYHYGTFYGGIVFGRYSGYYNPYNPYHGWYNHGLGYGHGFGYGYGYSPYNYGGHYGYGGYHGGGYYGGVANNNTNQSNSKNSYYGQRNNLSSSSARSSYYPGSQSMINGKMISSSDKITHTAGSSRRSVQKSSAGAQDYSNDKFDHNGVPIKNNAQAQGLNQRSSSISNPRARNSYTPSTSARRTGVVKERRSVSPSSTTRRTSGSNRNSGVSNTNRRNTQISSPQRSTPSSSTPRVRQTQSRSSSFSRSSGSSSRSSSGSSSSSTSRRR